jgi:hypothetical protein
MKEWLLLNGIALYTPDISPRHIKDAVAVVAYLAHTGLAFRHRTAMSTGKTTYSLAIKFLVEFTLADLLVDDGAEGCHKRALFIL